MSSSSSPAFSVDQLSPPQAEQLCYVHCNFCDTVLAVSVPCSSLFKTVTVRCGHCTNLLSVNMRALLFPPANQIHFSHAFLGSSPQPNLLDELAACQNPSLVMDHLGMLNNNNTINNNNNNNHNNLVSLQSQNSTTNTCMMPPPVKISTVEELPRINPVINRPPEKRQRVPSAYNRFIKEEIQRIKAGNPDISHREAFSLAAKNWAHFPHIQFGLMPDQGLKKASMRQQGEDQESVLLKDGIFAAAAAANMGIAHF